MAETVTVVEETKIVLADVAEEAAAVVDAAVAADAVAVVDVAEAAEDAVEAAATSQTLTK